MTQHIKQRGFTLVEVLVTMIIMAVGLLGLAGLQATSLRNTESAYQRSQAATLAYDMLDRMRANTVGVDGGSYNDIDIQASNPVSVPGCGSSTCDSSDMATYDEDDWRTQVAALLPSGVGGVSGSGTGSIFTITVTWADDRTNDTTTSFTLSSRI